MKLTNSIDSYMDETRFLVRDTLSRAAHHYRQDNLYSALGDVREALGRIETLRELESYRLIELDTYDSNWLRDMHSKANRTNRKLLDVINHRD